MYIQGLTFFVTISKKIKYITIEHIKSRSKSSMDKAFDTVFQVYNKAGFRISKVYGDPEFEMMRNTFIDLDIELNSASAQEHVPEVERAIRVIKERFRALYHRLPYQAIPKNMIIIGAMECARWLNFFPPKGGVSEYYSPHIIMMGKAIDYNKHCTTAFGTYVQALTENNPTNTTEQRTIGCIYLRSLENEQGGYELLDLNTGRVISRRKYYEIPVTQQVINRVEELAHHDGIRPDLVFQDRKGDLLMNDLIAGVDDDEYQDENEDEDPNYINNDDGDRDEELIAYDELDDEE